MTSDPTLKAKVLTDSEANETVIKSLRNVLDFVSYFIGSLMAIGAVCGALSSLYAAVAARRLRLQPCGPSASARGRSWDRYWPKA